MKCLTVILAFITCFSCAVTPAMCESSSFSLNCWGGQNPPLRFLYYYDEPNDIMYYCINERVDLLGLFRVSSIYRYSNGKKTLLLSVINSISHFLVADDTIYYVLHHINSLNTDGELVAFDMSKRETKVLLGRSYAIGGLFRLQGECLFLETGKSIAKYNTNTCELKELYPKDYGTISTATEHGITTFYETDWVYIDYSTLQPKYLKLYRAPLLDNCNVMAISENQYIAYNYSKKTCLIVCNGSTREIMDVDSVCLTNEFVFLSKSYPTKTAQIYRMNQSIDLIFETETNTNSSIYGHNGSIVLIDGYRNIKIIEVI